MKKRKTTIKISTELKNKLAKLGSKDETYEQIIEKLLSYKVPDMPISKAFKFAERKAKRFIISDLV